MCQLTESEMVVAFADSDIGILLLPVNVDMVKRWWRKKTR